MNQGTQWMETQEQYLAPKEVNLQIVGLEEACRAFRARCHSLNLADSTLAWYELILKDLGRFLADQRDMREISPAKLREFLSSLRERGQSSETIFRTWGALKCFFRFLARDGMIAVNPMAMVERPRRERHLIEPFNVAQVRELLNQPNTNKTQGLRDRAMMMLMVDSGLRISEVLGIESRRIFWKDRVLTVLGKGRKERAVPIGQNALLAMEAYAQARGPGGTYFFLSRLGRPVRRRYFQTAMRRYGRHAKLEGVRVSPHTLRHTFAIQYIKNGGDAFSLQSILGHSSLDMVRNYVNLARKDVAEQHRKFAPMDRWLQAAPSRSLDAEEAMSHV